MHMIFFDLISLFIIIIYNNNYYFLTIYIYIYIIIIVNNLYGFLRPKYYYIQSCIIIPHTNKINKRKIYN